MQFVAVRSYDNYIAANMMLQQLEHEGIKAYLQDEYTVTIDPVLSNAIGGIKLMIYKPQLPRALELIDILELSYKKAVACPQCGSLNVQYITQPKKVTNWLSAVLTWLFGGYAIAVKQVYHCFDCGNEYANLPE